MMNNSITHLGTRDEIACVNFNDVMVIIADGNYVRLTLRSGRTMLLLSGLHDMENVATRTCTSFRKVGRSHVVNLKYIAVINTAKRTITLADDSVKTSIDINVSKEAALALKRYMEELKGDMIVDFIPTNGHMSAKVVTNSYNKGDNS